MVLFGRSNTSAHSGTKRTLPLLMVALNQVVLGSSPYSSASHWPDVGRSSDSHFGRGAEAIRRAGTVSGQDRIAGITASGSKLGEKPESKGFPGERSGKRIHVE